MRIPFPVILKKKLNEFHNRYTKLRPIQNSIHTLHVKMTNEFGKLGGNEANETQATRLCSNTGEDERVW